jgi:hypothetical protein
VKSLEQLRVDADQRKAVFFLKLAEVSDELRPVHFVDRALGALDPDFATLTRIEDKAKRNPLVALAAMGGVMLLARQLSTEPRKRVGRSRLTRTTARGDYHGDHSAKY